MNKLNPVMDATRKVSKFLDDTPVPATLFDCIVDLNTLARTCHRVSVKCGWWHDPETGKKISRNRGEMLSLIHAEVSEALEGFRKDNMDEHLPHRKSSEVELADAVIRIFDLAESEGYDLGGAILEKLAYNCTRDDHKPEVRKKHGGKKF